MELLKNVDPKEYEKYARMYGITDFRGLLQAFELLKASREEESRRMVCLIPYYVFVNLGLLLHKPSFIVLPNPSSGFLCSAYFTYGCLLIGAATFIHCSCSKKNYKK